LEELDIAERIILKWMYGGKGWWIGFMLLRTVVCMGVMLTD